MTLEERREFDKANLLRELEKLGDTGQSYRRFKRIEQAACRLRLFPSYAYAILYPPKKPVESDISPKYYRQKLRGTR